jgi:hypothetical protein
MGCDIHCFVEQKADDRWEQIGDFLSDWYEEGDKYFGEERFKYSDSPIDCRNYSLFGVLAGVRRDFTPIADPRGIPEDVSDSIGEDYKGWGCDAHTPSWLTVKELLDHDWDQLIRVGGLVDQSGFKEYIKRGEPSIWCGNVFGGDTKIISQDRMMVGIKGLIPLPEGHTYYCGIEWTNKLSDYLGKFLKDTLPQLEKRCNGDPENFRIVFWFDN